MKLFEVTETDEQQPPAPQQRTTILVIALDDEEAEDYTAAEIAYMFVNNKFYKTFFYYFGPEGEVDNGAHRHAIDLAKHLGLEIDVTELNITLNDESRPSLIKAGLLDEDGYPTDDVDADALRKVKYLKIAGKKHYLVK